jgi:RHS repeat-associated protein
VNGYVERESAAPWVRRYEHSPEGYLLSTQDSESGTTRYDQDAAHRIIAEWRPNGAVTRIEHDAAGNLLRNGSTALTFHPGNVLATASGRVYEHDTRQAVSSERSGQMARRFHRDERDQLVRIDTFIANGGAWTTGPAWTAKYDALGRRISKDVGGQKTHFLWDSDRLVAEILPTGQLRIYVYPDALAQAPILFIDYVSTSAEVESGAVYAVFADHLGCPVRIEDMAGDIVWTATIRPYGSADIRIGTDFHQPLRWPGHYWDRELELHYNRFRTYSPDLGRYLEPDPLGRAGDTENVYAYTPNPLRWVDIDGLGACPLDGKKKGKNKKKDEEEKPDAEPDAKKPSQDELDDARKAAEKNVRDLKKSVSKPPTEAELAGLEDARRERYEARCAAAGKSPDWEVWDRNRGNQQRGSEREEKALAAAGLENNNAKGNQQEFTTDDGVTTRPDAVSDNAIVDVKSKPDTGGPHTIEDSDQMQAQRDMADEQGKSHYVVASNTDKGSVAPSQDLTDAGSNVLHHNPETGKWNAWNPNANDGTGGWEPTTKSAVQDMLGGGG